MADAAFQIGAEGVDVERVMREIRERVETRRAEGAYADPRIARAERYNLSNLKDDREFLPFYLELLRDLVFVDINDFRISERRRHVGWVLVRMKMVLWKLLKFYTYRLWSQQNQINGMLLTTAEALEHRYRADIDALEKRVTELEAKQDG